MITVTRYDGKVKLSHMGHIIWLTNAEAKELAVELYKMSDGGDGSVTVTGDKNV